MLLIHERRDYYCLFLSLLAVQNERSSSARTQIEQRVAISAGTFLFSSSLNIHLPHIKNQHRGIQPLCATCDNCNDSFATRAQLKFVRSVWDIKKQMWPRFGYRSHSQFDRNMQPERHSNQHQSYHQHQVPAGEGRAVAPLVWKKVTQAGKPAQSCLLNSTWKRVPKVAVPSVVKRFESFVIDRELFLSPIEGNRVTLLPVTWCTRRALYLPAAWRTMGAPRFAC